MILSKTLIAMYPEMTATINPAMHAPISTFAPPICLSSKTAAPKIAGIDKMKLNFAANSLSNPANNPAAIVVPERERPGRIANACPHPIKRASLIEKFLTSILPLFILWDTYKRQPVINSRNAGMVNPVNSSSIASLNNTPTIPTGMVAIIVSHANFL